jgi:hypothetical protein
MINKSFLFLGLILFLDSCTWLQNAGEARELEVGRAISYSTLYDAAITTQFFRDFTYTGSNSDLSFHYTLIKRKEYLFSKDSGVILFLPLDKSLQAGDRWQRSLVAFEILEKTDDGYLLSSNFLGERKCFDGWKTGKTRIFFSFKGGLVNTSTEQLECDTNSLKGYTVTDYSGYVWALEGP